MARNRLVVATFNTEWRKAASQDAGLIRERLSSAEIVCLTEAYHDFFNGEGHILKPPFTGDGDDDGRRKVLLWSKRPWTAARVGEGDLPSHYLAGTTETQLGPIAVHGVVIPYRFSGVRYGIPKRKLWEMHKAFLANLDQLLPETPQHSILLGDFNQRSPARYQPRDVTKLLESVILGRFQLATGGLIPGIDEHAIDHICHTADLTLESIRGLTNRREDGRLVSDHFGLQAIYE